MLATAASSPASLRRLVSRAALSTAGLSLVGCVAPDTSDRFKAKHGEFGARSTWVAPVSAVGSWLPEGTIHGEPGEVKFVQGLLDATVPIPVDDDEFVIAGALAGVRHVQFDGVPVLADDDLHRYGIRIGYGKFINDDLMVQGYWQPSIYSDLDGTLKSEDYRLYYGVGLAVWRTSPDWYWKLGIAGTDRIDTGVLPLAGFTWHFADEWSFQVLIPRDATLVWEHGPWQVSTGLLVDADEYHVRSPDSLGLEDDVHVQEFYAHVTVERDLTENLSLLVRSGATVSGRWDWGYGNGTDDLTGAIEPDVFVAAGFGYRF